MQERAGLPIAAYMGALVALALAAAFVATLAVVIFLPPRPPDVMRADTVSEHFEEGYDHMVALGRTTNERGIIWEVREEPPERSDSPFLRMARHQLAQQLELEPDQVRVAAEKVTTDDALVFRVRDIAEGEGDVEVVVAEVARAVAEVQRAHEAAQARVEAAREHAEAAAQAREDAREAAQAREEVAHDYAEAIAQAREEAAEDRADTLAEARENSQRLRAYAVDQERLEVLARRQAEAAERQVRAAERLRARIESRIRVQQGRVIISRDGDTDVDVDIDLDDFEREFGDLEELGILTEIEISEIDVHTVPPVGVVTPSAPTVAVSPTPPVQATPPPPPPAPSAPPQTATAPTTARTAPAVRVPPSAPPAPMFAPAPAGVVLISGFEFGAQLPDGRWLVMRQGRNWAEIGWIGRAAAVIGGTLGLLSLLAVLFARRLTRPIRAFSDAVQAVGVNPQSEPVREEGPAELRGAARAVNTMQARLRALIADRTKTLAAVAHDMRTPLMRLRLTAENAPPEQRDRMAKEIEEVEALVASFIAFARDDPAEEPRVRLDIAALLQSIAYDHAEHGRNVSYEGEERVIVTGQSLGLKRVFSNLVENALKYGGCARIKLRVEEEAVVVDVEDDGPGVPSDQRESVFEPFVRLNEEGTRGAGLGLAAARSIARAHGGDIAILDTEHGALVRVTLPI